MTTLYSQQKEAVSISSFLTKNNLSASPGGPFCICCAPRELRTLKRTFRKFKNGFKNSRREHYKGEVR